MVTLYAVTVEFELTEFALNNRGARRVFMDRHLLMDTPQGSATPDDMRDVIHSLGFVQLDSINTVARAHDLILFTRKARYLPRSLKTLYEKDRGLFEHWTHDAAVIPMEFYPHWQMRRDRDAIKLQKQWKNWRRDGFEGQLQAVMDQIREQGPLSSSNVGKTKNVGQAVGGTGILQKPHLNICGGLVPCASWGARGFKNGMT